MVHATDSAASRFLTEAGLAPSIPFEPPAATAQRTGKDSAAAKGGADGNATRSGRDKPDSRKGLRPVGGGPRASGVAEARRVGLGYALRTATSRETALDLAAAAIEQRIVGPQTASERMSVGEMLAAIEPLNDAERAALAHAAGIDDGATLVGRLDATRRSRLVHALRQR